MGCILCEQASPGFGPCSHCGSYPRHRELAWFVARKVALPEGAKVLEIGPAPVQLAYFPRLLQQARYTAVDSSAVAGETRVKAPHRFLRMEATRLTFSDQSFDLILASHLFPYIRSDYQAMSQVHRCLKEQGMAILSAPVLPGKTRKASDTDSREPGMEWVYGEEDYFERLEAAGFFPHRLKLAELAGPKVSAEQGFSPDSELVLGFKFGDVRQRFLEAL